ncbi:DUF4012 domain-containing protein [Microbacterium sp. lyk4-40-TSB-66]|uniref:DUF4012 domain-containing protein n=1 Tax=Microbacterium sp. lyk4-40-TSB-66 TaxID=3040294 RepID=UPI00254FA3B1|nr:DUF4012 domain-containing protein [Microbacterium sp. lyk4-40-TSB-66]
MTRRARRNESPPRPAAGEHSRRALRNRTEADAAKNARRPWYRRPTRVAALFFGTVAALVGVLAVILAAQAASVRDDLRSAHELIASLQSAMVTGDADALQSAAAEASERVSRASQTVRGPLWEAGSVIPAVGANLRAITDLTAAVQTLATDALPPGSVILSKLSVDKIALADGGVDLQPFRESQASIPLVAAAFADARGQTDAIDVSDLLPAVADSVSEVRTFMDDATDLLDVAQKYLPTLLDVAGGQSPQTYLVLFQNNAEVRATGGNPAASLIVRADQGRVEILDRASSLTFDAAGDAGRQFADLPPETLALYPSTFALYSQDFTMTPDFPTTVRLFQDLWRQTSGEEFDGVISIDPVVLSHMLAVTGPVDYDDLELTADNAVQVLLSDAYERFPTGEESDAFFTAISQGFFQYLTTSRWDPTQMLGALELSATEQRLLMSFRDEAAQALAEEFDLDGSLRADTVESTQIGTYLNDYSVGKLEYHLRQTVIATCDAAARTVTTTTALANEIPSSIQSTYTLGARNPRFGYPRTAMMIDVLFFAPPGAQIVSTDPAVGDVAEFDRAGSQSGNSAVSRLVVIPQGESRTVSSTIRLPDGALGPLDLRHTPLTSPTTVTVDGSCDALFGPDAAITG